METHTVENWTEVPFIGIQVSKFETPKNAFEYAEREYKPFGYNTAYFFPAIDEASASLGASGGRTFRKISLPLIRGAFLTGLMFAFARSMTTLSPIIFITTPDTPILTSLILAEADTVRYGYAFAFCTLLIGIVLITMGLINLIVRKTQGTGYRPITVSAG